MSTNALISVIDANRRVFTIYKHWDGYPSQVLPGIKRALLLTWPLPRFEAAEFAAALVAAMKTGPGDVMLHSCAGMPRANESEFVYRIGPGPQGVRVEVFSGGRTASMIVGKKTTAKQMTTFASRIEG